MSHGQFSLTPSSCYDCPFIYDGFRCQHPEGPAFVKEKHYYGEATSPPADCPLHKGPATIALTTGDDSRETHPAD